MKKFGDFVVDKRFLILAIFILLVIASVVLVFFVPVNSDILSYLPSGITMTNGLEFMQENFDMQGDALVGIDNITYAEMQTYLQDLSSKYEGDGKGIKPGGIIWIGTIKDMESTEINLTSQEISQLMRIIMNDPELKQALADSGMSLTSLSDMSSIMKDLSSEMLKNQSLLSIFYPNPAEDGTITFNENEKAQYLFMLQLNVASSSDEAMDVLNYIDKSLSQKGYEHAIGGSTEIVREIFSSTIDEMWKYISVAVLVMFIVLLLTTNTLIDPIIFMLTIGVSIIINMGTNIVFPDVSIVTFACSAVLQLALSMDYSIFLMHTFAEEKKMCLDEKEAMKRAIPKTFTTVTASALTTLGGFMALFAMRFGIGADLGRVLAKGVFLSLVTVILLQPCLMLMMSKAREKTTHKIRLPKFKSAAKLSISKRYVIVILALIILIPAVVLQSLEGNRLSYIKFVETPQAEEGDVQYSINTLSNSIIVMVPVGDKEANEAFCNDMAVMKENGEVSAYMSVYTMIPEKYSGFISMVSNEKILAVLGNKEGMEMMTGFINNGYTLYEVMIKCDAESPEAAAILNKVTMSLNNNFAKEEEDSDPYYLTGMAQAVLDLKDITPRDNMLVSLISVLVILVILIISQRSFKVPVLLVALIEFGIFINLALCYIANEEINFMCYIILSSIQLGSTVDYAILYTDKYNRNLEYLSANEAAYKALRDSAVSILTSVAIMAGCCLSVTIVASNTIVKQITWLIARGSIISGILTIVVLPALLVVFTGNKKLKKRGKQQSRIMRAVETMKTGNSTDSKEV